VTAVAIPFEQPRSFDWRHAAYCLLHVIGTITSTLLMSWGLLVLFFLMLGDFSFDGLMHQLYNLTSRYMAADRGRATAFFALLGGVQLCLLACLLLLRRHSIMPRRAACRSHIHV
jgi:uncharacterized membrane protein YjjP (DUF1212 family)